MGSPALAVPSTLDAFLEWEAAQPERFELAGGVVRLMAGGSEDHDRISLNIAAALRLRLRGTPCSAHSSNLKVLSRAANAVMYPDAFVRCGPREGGRAAVDDPVVVVEVLSESTAKHDLTRKRLAYEAIPSLRRIVYVSTDEARLDLRVRGADGLWRDEAAVEGLGGTLALPELDLALPLAEIYEDSEVASAAA
jgi:Uma2 family endonuclease